MFRFLLTLLCLASILSCQKRQSFDILIQNGNVYDGSGKLAFIGDVGISDDRIAYVGKPLKKFKAKESINANRKIVSPGFVNMLSWSGESLIQDGRALSGI